MQSGYAVIPSSTKRANLESNLGLRADPERCRHGVDRQLDRGHRLTSPKGIAPQWD
jgi:2,5-diketo-D-gluconate reductase B